MAKSNKVLTIDITNESVTIIEITASAKKQTQVHNAIIFETPEDAYEDGNIKNKEKLASAIRDHLDENGITNKNAIFVLSSTKVVNREVIIPAVKESKVKDVINSNASEYFPVNIDDYIISHSILESVVGDDKAKQLRVLAVAAPSYMVKGYYDTASLAGLSVESIDFVGNAMLQLIKTQTSANATTMVIQLGSDSSVLNIVKGETLLLQRTVPYGTSTAVNEVMDEKGVDATTAMTMLQNDRMVTVDFDDNAVTGSFRYLINNIGRVMDYYASKNPDKPIEEVYLCGDGALIRGLDGLFKIQLNVTTRIMDSLYNVKFDSKIDQKIYNPAFLIAPIGAAFAPMGFSMSDAGGTKKKSAASAKSGAAVFVICLLAAAGGCGAAYVMKDNAQKEKTRLQQEIARIQEIDTIVSNYDAAKAKYEDMYTMFRMTENLNENVLTFINALEECLPKSMQLSSFSSTETGAGFSAVASSYDEIADLVMSLREIPCISNAYVSAIAEELEESGKPLYTFSLTCEYVSMVTPENTDLVGGDSESTEESTSEGASEAE